MRRVIIALLLLALPAFAKNHPDVVVRGQRLTNRVVFVLDVSESMDHTAGVCVTGTATRYQVMKSEVARVTTLLGDDARVKFIAFGAFPVVYNDRWTELPNEDAVHDVGLWLDTTHTTSIVAATNILPPLRLALANPQEDLSVLVISDAEWGDGHDIDAIAEVNGKRAAGPCPIAIEGVGDVPAAEDMQAATKLAEQSRSYFIKVR